LNHEYLHTKILMIAWASLMAMLEYYW